MIYWSLGLRGGSLGLGIHMWNVSPELVVDFFQVRLSFSLTNLYGANEIC